jgi:hypothetical protein
MEVFEMGQFVADFMDQINEDFGDEAVIRTFAVVAEVDHDESTTLLVNCDDDRAWVQMEFLNQAIDGLEHRMETLRDRDSDD